MSVKRMDSYTILCDYPECDANVMEDSDYSGWGDLEYLSETLHDAGWLTVDGGSDKEDTHYCGEHQAWTEDEDHLVPAPDTFAWQIDRAMAQVMRQTTLKVDRIIHELNRSIRAERHALRQITYQQGATQMTLVADADTLVAAGGWCAPTTNVYHLEGRG